MSDYKVLYRKWRPVDFDDVCGQESVTFSTDRMTITDNTRVTETVLFSHTVKVPSGEAVGVSASWLFNGVYAGVELGELTVSGTVPAR